jgi:hypothetical protein
VGYSKEAPGLGYVGFRGWPMRGANSNCDGRSIKVGVGTDARVKCQDEQLK